MTRSFSTDQQLGPIVRDAFAQIIDELPEPTRHRLNEVESIDDEQHEPPRRSSRVLVVAAATLVLIAGLAGVAQLRDGTNTDPANSSVSVQSDGDSPTMSSIVETEPSTPSVTIEAPTSPSVPDDIVVEQPLSGGIWIGARTDNAGSTLLLFFVGAAEYEPGQPCTMRYLPTVAETDTQIHVAIRGERPASPHGGDTAVCRTLGFPRSVTVELSRPFGDRELIVLGAQREVFDGSLLAQPQWIPDGWQQTNEEPGSLAPGPEASWARSWAPPRPAPSGETCVPGTTGFTLFEGPSSIADAFPAESGETEAGSYDVNGATATYSTQTDQSIVRLTWVTGDRGFVLKTFPMCLGDEPPSLDTMLRFARDLTT